MAVSASYREPDQRESARADRQATVVALYRRSRWRGWWKIGHGELRRHVQISHHSMPPKNARPTSDGTTNNWAYCQPSESSWPETDSTTPIPYSEHSPGGSPTMMNSTVTTIFQPAEPLMRSPRPCAARGSRRC